MSKKKPIRLKTMRQVGKFIDQIINEMRDKKIDLTLAKSLLYGAQVKTSLITQDIEGKLKKATKTIDRLLEGKSRRWI